MQSVTSLRSCAHFLRSTASLSLLHRSFISTPNSNAKGQADDFGHKGQSDMYHLYRPRYPLSMLQEIHQRVPTEKSKRSIAVDIACGTGLLTTSLAKPLNFECKTRDDFGLGFKKVIGIDTSQAQLDKANEHNECNNIEFQWQDIDGQLSFETDSVDLVTIGQGLHWFDIPKLLQEIKRILKPETGVLTVCGYGAPRFDQYEQFHKAFGNFYVRTLGSYNYGVEGKKCYWKIDRKLLDTGFEDKTMFVGGDLFDEASFERIFFFENEWMNEETLFGYFRSMSGYNQYMQENSIEYDRDGDPINDLRNVYRADMKKYDQSKMMAIFPFFMLMMQK